MNPLGLPAILTGFVLIQVVHGGLIALSRWQGRERSPVTGKLLRPAGEHERVRLSFLEEQTRWLLLGTSTIPIVILLAGALALAGRAPDDHSLTVPILAALGFLATAGTGGYFLHQTLAERRHRGLALQGHRIVNDSLAPLIPAGFKIFHDIPTEPNNPDNNLHHLVIGPSGIFAIESRTPAIRPTIPGRKPQEIIFDGDQLIYPWGQDNAGIVPTRQKAEWLSEWIFQLVGQRVPINAVLTFPGWWVTSTAVRDIRVFNPNQLAALVQQAPDTNLPESTRNLLIRNLEIRCRDVEC